jgi:DNA-binding IclR family transcriptional regulator
MTTIGKSLQVLRVVADRSGAQIAALEEATGIPKSTLYRLLRDLDACGLARQSPTGGWHVGRRVFDVAATAFRSAAPTEAQRAVLVDLSRSVHLTVHMSVLRNRELVYVDKLAADTPFTMRSQVGRVQAIHSSAIGRSVLSLLPPEEARRILDAAPRERLTPRTTVDVDRILRGLTEVRRLGWASDDEEDEVGTRAIGAAFVDAEGRPRGGLSIVAPTFSVTMAELSARADELCRAAERIGHLFEPV